MASAKRKEKKQNTESALNKFSLNSIIPEKYQTIALLALIFGIFLVFYSPMYFGDQTMESGDIVTANSVRSFLDNDREDFTLWYPYIFCGMPAYALAVDYKWFNILYVGLRVVRDMFTSAFANEYSMWTLFLLILAFTSYFLTTYLTKNRLIGLFVGLSSAFSTGIIVFLFIGHVTKLTALCFFPLILLMILKFEKEIKLRDFAILVIAWQLAMQGWHVQIIFYMLAAVGIYYLYNFVFSLIAKKKSETVQLAKSFGSFSAAFLIALLIQSDNLTQIYQYNPYSTRGTKSIVELEKEGSQQSESEFYQYATNWSFSPGEIATFVIPSYFGFGKSTYKGSLTKNREFEVNTYFGQMPFVDVAMYMGVIIFFLALYSIYANRKNRFVQVLALISGVSLLISFGRTFPFFYDLMFNYFPFFDKFRVPSMVLVLIQLCFPVLAGLGLYRIIQLRKEGNEFEINVIKYAAYIFTGLLVLSLLLNSSISEWFTGRVNDYVYSVQKSQPRLAQQFSALAEYMSGMFVKDIYFAFGLSALTFWLAFGYIKSKLSAHAMIISIIILSTFDLIRIDNRGSYYNEAKNNDELFTQPDYITVIKNEDDQQPYRMLNLKQDGSLGSFNRNSNYNSHFLVQDFYGYSAIKPRSFQDLMDVVGPANITMWRMLNVKYIITDKGAKIENLDVLKQTATSTIYKNSYALPRAYFVDSVATASSIEILNKIKSNLFNPKQIAFTTDNTFKIDKPDSTAFAEIVSYKDEKIDLKVKATGNNLLFLGDTYYPNGWNAYIDGRETEIYRINHGFRGIIVPEGEHNITFKYLPVSFTVAKYVALILSSFTVIGLFVGIVTENKKKKITGAE